MASRWIYKYKSDTIVVTNDKEENELFVNGELQDKGAGLFKIDLKGISSENEEIKVHIGGTFSVNCTLSVGCVLLAPAETIDDIQKSTWTYKYGSNIITVINDGIKEELYVNSKLQDTHKSILPALSSTLKGNLDSGEELKVQICGGFTGLKCKVFIDNKLQELEAIDKTV